MQARHGRRPVRDRAGHHGAASRRHEARVHPGSPATGPASRGLLLRLSDRLQPARVQRHEGEGSGALLHRQGPGVPLLLAVPDVRAGLPTSAARRHRHASPLRPEGLRRRPRCMARVSGQRQQRPRCGADRALAGHPDAAHAEGKTSGGDFSNIPLCTGQGKAGCVVACSTHSRTLPILLPFFGNSLVDPLSLSIGHRTGPRYSVACTNPEPLSGSTARSESPSRPSRSRRAPFAPDPGLGRWTGADRRHERGDQCRPRPGFLPDRQWRPDPCAHSDARLADARGVSTYVGHAPGRHESRTRAAGQARGAPVTHVARQR